MKYNVLVADDERFILQSLEFILEAENYNVTTVENGREALELLMDSENSFDILITDVQMPGLNGLELVTELEERGISIPVIIISGYTDHRIITSLKRKGYDNILNKPFDDLDLIKKMKRIINSRAQKKKKIKRMIPII